MSLVAEANHRDTMTYRQHFCRLQFATISHALFAAAAAPLSVSTRRLSTDDATMLLRCFTMHHIYWSSMEHWFGNMHVRPYTIVTVMGHN